MWLKIELNSDRRFRIIAQHVKMFARLLFQRARNIFVNEII